MPRGYLIDADGIKRLREDHEILLRRMTHLEQRIANTAAGAVRRNQEFCKVTTQISPRDTSTSPFPELGSGKAILYRITKQTDALHLQFGKVTYTEVLDRDDIEVEVDVYNTSLVPVPYGAYVRIVRDFRSGLWMVGEVQTALAQASSSGVSARSGTTAGSGTVTVAYIDGATLTSTGVEIDVHNMSATAVAANAFITIKRISLDEEWIVDAEDCG